jgi:hypothetical protein
MPPDLPLALAEWPRNERETVRVRLDRYNGHVVVDCRCWWSDASGELKPGRGGLTLAVRHLPALADAVAAALTQAQVHGLLVPEPSAS